VQYEGESDEPVYGLSFTKRGDSPTKKKKKTNTGLGVWRKRETKLKQQEMGKRNEDKSIFEEGEKAKTPTEPVFEGKERKTAKDERAV